MDKVLKKVVEEAGEVALAGKGGKKEEIIYETADLLFHTLVALGFHDIKPEKVYKELAARFGTSGLKAKAQAQTKTNGKAQARTRAKTATPKKGKKK